MNKVTKVIFVFLSVIKIVFSECPATTATDIRECLYQIDTPITPSIKYSVTSTNVPSILTITYGKPTN